MHKKLMAMPKENKQNGIEEVPLKNGATEKKSFVMSTMISLESLLNTKPGAFYELVMKCRDNNHSFFGNTGEVLQNSRLAQPDGRIHDSIKNIVLSAVQGDSLDMQLSNPISDEIPAH